MKLSRNIPLFYTVQFVNSFWFWIPIYVIFLLDRGMSLGQVLLLEAIFSILVVSLEVPSGYFADIRGRKLSSIISIVGLIAAPILFLLGTEFWHFLFAMVAWAIGDAFRSGSDEALIYDTLSALKQEKRFATVQGRISFIAMIGAAIASVIGGMIGEIDLALPFLLNAATGVIAVLILLFVVEPPREKPIIEKGHLQNLWSVTRYCMQHPTLRRLFGFNIFVSGLGIVLYYLLQPYILELGLPISALGWAFALWTGAVAVGTLLTPKIIGRVSTGYLLLSVIVGMAATSLILALTTSVWGLALIVLLGLVMGVSFLAIITIVNDITTSDKRATVNSVVNIGGRLADGAFALALGPIAELFGLRITMMVIAGIALIGGGYFSIRLLKIKTP